MICVRLLDFLVRVQVGPHCYISVVLEKKKALLCIESQLLLKRIQGKRLVQGRHVFTRAFVHCFKR